MTHFLEVLHCVYSLWYNAVFLNRRAAARYRGPGINYTGPRKILLELVINLNVILYLSTCHTVHIIVLIFFMIMP